MMIGGLVCTFAILFGSAVGAFTDTPRKKDLWSDVIRNGKSVVFGRFVGKFESTAFRSRRVRLREVSTGKEELLEVDEGLGFIAEKIPPGLYDVVGVEAVYFPRTSGPRRPERYRPIRQRFSVKPKSGDASGAMIFVPPDRPVYIGTIRAGNPLDGIVYRGHQLRVVDDFDESYDRLSVFYPQLVGSLNREGIVPARHFMLKPTVKVDPLERVVGQDDPIRQARQYITEGKFKQAISWLETFMPASDSERSEVKLLVGEALLGDKEYTKSIEALGQVLLMNPTDMRALRLLARAHAFDGHLEDAQSLYEGVIQSLPEDAEANLHLGYLYALQENRVKSQEQFAKAFSTDFDYLLNDFTPFFIALREALEGNAYAYKPPRILRYTVPPPRSMESRRASKGNAFAVLVDHGGKAIAAQIGRQSTGNTPFFMHALLKARYEPASLNGIPVPALVIMGRTNSDTQ